MRIAVVEDWKYDRDRIQSILEKCRKKYGTELDVCYFDHGENLCHELEDGISFDAYFLDVEMPKMDGIQTAEYIRKCDKEAYLVFVTSHLGYAPKASQYLIFRYIDKANIDEMLPQTLASIQEDMAWRKAQKQFLHISTPRREERIEYRDILHIYKEEKDAVIVMKNGVSRVRQSLEETYSQLDSEVFLFADRSHIVNMNHVMKIDGNRLYLRDKSTLQIGKAKQEEARRRLREFWGFKA